MPKTGPTPADPLRVRIRAALAEHRRRARRDRQTLDYGLADLEALARQVTTCTYCRQLLTPDTLAFDHKVPTARVADYRLGNLAVCCVACNLAKGLLSAEEFAQLLALIRTWPPRAGNDLLGRLRAGGRRYAVGRGGWG